MLRPIFSPFHRVQSNLLIASRVVGEPVVPAGEAATGVDASEVAPAAGADSTVAETTPPSTTRETAPKPNKRNSIFGSIFGKKDTAAPASTPASTETPPAVPAKDEPSTVSPTAPQLDNPVTSPTAETTAATTETPTAAAAEESTPAATTTPLSPTDKRRTSFFSNLGTKKERRTGEKSDNELTDGEGKKSSGGFGGLLRKASRAQKGSSTGTSKDPANVPLPTETPAVAVPTTNGDMFAEKPAETEGETGNMTGAPEQTPVPTAA